MNKRRTAYDLTKTAMMLALALVLSILEAWLLPKGIIPVPGFKLGLANIALLVTLYSVGRKEALLVAVLRSLLLLAFGGNIVGFVFSLLGGICAWATMCAVVDLPKVSIFGTSIAGAATHGIGQIIAALLLTRTFFVLLYLPYLILLGSAAGALVAFLTIPVVKALDHIGNEMIQ